METQHNPCPWWLGYTFLIPLRKFHHDPYKILGPYIKPGMYVMDYGCAMGYFSIPMAKLTGNSGKVYCIDIQDKMLKNLQKRAVKHNVSHIVEPLLVKKSFKPELLKDKLDFVLIFMVVHEVPDKVGLFYNLYSMLKTGGKVLFFEPKGHVKPSEFENSIMLAKLAGFIVSTEKSGTKGQCVLLEKL